VSADGAKAARGLRAEGVGEPGWTAVEGEVGIDRGDHPDQRLHGVGAEVQQAAAVVDGLDDAHARQIRSVTAAAGSCRVTVACRGQVLDDSWCAM
jgi:hypothetical protein